MLPVRSFGYDATPPVLGSTPLEPELVEPWLKTLLYIGRQTGRFPEIMATDNSMPDHRAPLISDPTIID
jgi:hypothetical protein